MTGPDRILTVPETAALLRDLTGVGSTASLNRWITTGHGPPRVKIGAGPRGRVGYRKSAVIAWVQGLGPDAAPAEAAGPGGGADGSALAS
ncbi:MAG: hypothetical protein RLY86_864 [Pseudomonadota bacterium]|jgi:predicted DNA-binding transcriptional regulator AlpA